MEIGDKKQNERMSCFDVYEIKNNQGSKFSYVLKY